MCGMRSHWCRTPTSEFGGGLRKCSSIYRPFQICEIAPHSEIQRDCLVWPKDFHFVLCNCTNITLSYSALAVHQKPCPISPASQTSMRRKTDSLIGCQCSCLCRLPCYLNVVLLIFVRCSPSLERLLFDLEDQLTSNQT